MSRNIHEIIKNMPWWARLEPVAGLLRQAFDQGWLAARVEFHSLRATNKDVENLKPAESHIRTALKDLLRATEPIVADKPATVSDYVELHDARKRALQVLEAKP